MLDLVEAGLPLGILGIHFHMMAIAVKALHALAEHEISRGQAESQCVDQCAHPTLQSHGGGRRKGNTHSHRCAVWCPLDDHISILGLSEAFQAKAVDEVIELRLIIGPEPCWAKVEVVLWCPTRDRGCGRDPTTPAITRFENDIVVNALVLQQMRRV